MRAWRVPPPTDTAPMAPSADDADLVAAAQIDRLAFAPLYERYRDDLLRYCYYCLGDWDDASDATQQIFTNVLAALPRFVDHGASFRPWLFRIAHNEVLSRQQRQARRPQNHLTDAADLADLAPSPEDLAIAADDHQRLWLLLRHLPSDRQRVCELRFAGLTDREIATALGKSQGAVRTAQSRAVAQLRELMRIHLAPTGGTDG